MKRRCSALVIPALVFFLASGLEASDQAPIKVKVTREMQSLGEICKFLYGRARMAPLVAKWNGIPSPYFVEIGQELVLKEPPSLSPEEGRQVLLEMWKRLGKTPPKFLLDDARFSAMLEDQGRFKGTPKPEPALSPTPSPSASPTPSGRSGEAPSLDLSREELSRLLPSSAVSTNVELSGPAPSVSAEVVSRILQVSEKETLEAVAVMEDIPSAEGLLKAGEMEFQRENCEMANVHFRRARKMDPTLLPAWFYQLRCLKLLGRASEAKAVAEELMRENPETAELPALQQYLSLE